MSKSERYLACYSGVLTLVFAAVVLTGASAARSGKFDEIDVQRINVREADGTLRMVISNHQRFPGLIVKGKEYAHKRPQAGMLFFNDEGTENGGLIFAGKRENGKVTGAGGSLTFDQYEHDQVVQLLGTQDDGREIAGMIVSDRPHRSIVADIEEKARIDAMPEAQRKKLMQERYTSNYYGQQRLFIGKNDSRSSLVNLKDGNGKTRLRLQVAADGAASIEFLDADGKVQRTLTPDSLAAK
ncbi:hypothetical protein IP90_02585 [Luteimonas cucumeris]|uniref:Uncharacterized protein n=1 Tax=Luteimonas cucumeris TaxID=985012 RepID=A0A562L043_9GAMM|nr:hypothetical protein [Luteimonas cucumeris]TWI00963.1 hypothetical protein IP90_02585 [Luteimonas cucumeris]